MKKTVLTNGKIYVEKGHFAEAMLIEGEVITEVGDAGKVLVLGGPDAEVIDLGGRTVLPGFNDSHLHIMNRAEVANQAEISSATSIQHMIDNCKEFMEKYPDRCKNGLHANGWNQDLFEEAGVMPTRYDLDKISTEIPIVLERICGHILTANSKTIEMMGITADTEIYGGTVELDETGVPNGIFTENACNLVKAAIPDFTWEERREFVLDSLRYAASKGVTSVQSNDVGTTVNEADPVFQMYHDIYSTEDKLIRFRHQVCFNDLEALRAYITEGEFSQKDELYPGNKLTLGPLKLFKDGSLGAKTALIRGCYPGEEGNHGLVWMDQEMMDEMVALAAEHGIQCVTHCIGDRAISDTIDSYEKSLPKEGGNPLRHCLIHCQITDKEMLERIKTLDIYTGVQPIFLDYDMHVVADRVGEELASTSYAFGTMKELGIHMSFGTDCPVEELDPFPNIYSAVTRLDKNGYPKGGFYPSEKMDVADAIDAYTIESAYMEFTEEYKGRLRPGYLADLIVLDRDVFTVEPEEIRNIEVDITMVGGEIIYAKN